MGEPSPGGNNHLLPHVHWARKKTHCFRDSYKIGTLKLHVFSDSMRLVGDNTLHRRRPQFCARADGRRADRGVQDHGPGRWLFFANDGITSGGGCGDWMFEPSLLPFWAAMAAFARRPRLGVRSLDATLAFDACQQRR